ncbi:MAG TPA: DUF4198 domain-containing protein [Thermoanaerobaculia bacterium]|nr:DUF4198 domain-containing protein [Thermoanaerobaculia bacterium]
MKPFTLALALFAAPIASAHDFWIEPSSFHPAANELVTAGLRVGQKMQGDPVPRIPPLVERFVLRSNDGESPMIGRPGSDPAGATRIAAPGLHWIGYQSAASSVILDAQKFQSYLREEGLDRITPKPENRERFYRCAKSLLAAGGGQAILPVPLGFTLELIPRKNPYALRANGELPIALLFREKPIANVLIVAMSKDDPEHPVRARTDSRGRATLRLTRPGFWLIKAVHMEPAPTGSGADWESWWASLTFDLAK